MSEQYFKILPSTMNEVDFVGLFGGVYEHTPWIASKAWQSGLTTTQDSVSGLATIMAAIVDQADQQKRLALILAHPDLAGKAAQSGTLTKESTNEQAGAGIDQCNAQEFEQFQAFNTAYKEKFGFPFIMAVKGSNRHLILAAFETRLQNDYESEFGAAIMQIHKIARFRLQEIADSQQT